MKMCMNFKFVVLFALTLLAGSTVYGQDNVIDEVVWVVGDEAILKSEVEEARMSALYEGRKFDRDPYCVIPEEIAVQKLFLHQAALRFQTKSLRRNTSALMASSTPMLVITPMLSQRKPLFPSE